MATKRSYIYYNTITSAHCIQPRDIIQKNFNLFQNPFQKAMPFPLNLIPYHAAVSRFNRHSWRNEGEAIRYGKPTAVTTFNR